LREKKLKIVKLMIKLVYEPIILHA